MSKRLVLLALCLTLTLAAWAEPETKTVYTDDMVRDSFNKSPELRTAHAVMLAQRQRLKTIMDMFLLGDLEGVANVAAELNNAMADVPAIAAGSAKHDPAVWKAMSQIVDEATLMQMAAQEQDSGKAYRHFTQVTMNCIQCHQVARTWGRLPVAQPEAEEPPDETPLPEAGSSATKS